MKRLQWFNKIVHCSLFTKVTHFYRPQRSWAKVMFLQASVILSTGGVVPDPVGVPGPEGGVPGRHPPGTRYTPLDQVHPPGLGTPPRPGTPLRPGPPHDQVHPRPGTPPPGLSPPPRTKYTPGVPPAGTHPTGMHSCNFVSHIPLSIKSFYIKIPNSTTIKKLFQA